MRSHHVGGHRFPEHFDVHAEEEWLLGVKKGSHLIISDAEDLQRR
jgi:hypothetical protein